MTKSAAGHLRAFVNVFLSLVLVLGLMPSLSLLAPIRAEAAEASGLGTVHVVVENATCPAPAAAWTGTLVDAEVTLTPTSTMMTCIKQAIESAGYKQTGADNGYISSINGLWEHDGDDYDPEEKGYSGWMGTLNGWFTSMGFPSYTVANGKLSDGDEIQVMYSCTGGSDLDNYWTGPESVDKTLKSVFFSVGQLDKAFSPDVHAYTLTVPAGTASIKASPIAANKAFQVRAFSGGTLYKPSAQVPVSDGAVITVKCGYADMDAADDVAGLETYTFAVAFAEPDYTPQITKQPADVSCKEGGSATLSVQATTFEPAVLSYQWFVLSNGSYVAVEGAVSANFSAPSDQMGEKTYCCDVTATVNGEGFTVRSSSATVTVKSAAAQVLYDKNLYGANVKVYDNGVLEFNAIAGSNGRTSSATIYGSPAYVTKYKSTITSIAIGEGITYLGDYLLNGLKATSITLPASLTGCGANAFYGCSSLKVFNCAEGCAIRAEGNFLLSNYGKTLMKILDASLLKGVVVIPSTVTEIGEQFRGNTAITGLVLPENLTTLAKYAFYGCEGLTEVTVTCNLPADNYAFTKCSNLASVTFAEGVTSVLGGGLDALESLTSMSFPSTLVDLNGYMIGNSVESVALAEGSPFTLSNGVIYKADEAGTRIVRALPNASIADESGALVVPEGITAIGNGAYRGRTNVVSVSFPSTLKAIGDYAFSDCSNLVGTLDIPQGITALGAYAFSGTGISKAVVPVGVSSIGNILFGYCDNLTELVIGSNVDVALSLVYQSDALESITLCEGVTTFSDDAFRGSTPQSHPKMATINLPSTLEEFCPTSFMNNPSLATINCAAGCRFSFENGLLIDGSTHSVVYAVPMLAGSVDVPEGIVSIADFAFFENVNVASVTFPSSLVSIGIHAFRNCTGLSGELVIPGSVVSIGENAFARCSGLTKVNCLDPSEPALVEYGAYAFSWCSNLTEVHLPQGLGVYDKLFYRCSSIVSLELPSTVTELGALGNNFDGMTALRSVSLPGVTKLGGYEFDQCTNLETISIPSVETVANCAFGWVGDNLNEMYLSKKLSSFENNVITYPKLIFYAGSQEEWGKISFGTTVLSEIEKSGSTVVFDYKASDEPLTVIEHPEDIVAVKGMPSEAVNFRVEAPEGSSCWYFWYDQSGACVQAGSSSSFSVTLAATGEYPFRCVAKVVLPDGSVRTASSSFTVTIMDSDGLFSGSGTEEDPYILSTAQDLSNLSVLVSNGVSYQGSVLKMSTDIELPNSWVPIGVTKDGSNNIKAGDNLNAFRGTFDGDGHTLTVPAGGKPLLNYVWGATIKNLNIYGERIEGYGLIDKWVGINLSGVGVTIDNVTLKSGTSTLKSGLLGGVPSTSGFACVSSGYVARVSNCTIEEGVTIGYDGSEVQIGSFAGRFQGTIANCISYATVQGKATVGGIIGTRDNAMGECFVEGCTFAGSVTATGECAGGIAGGGYDNSTAPNGARPSIVGCTVTGSVSGTKYVGGVFGGDLYVAQTWDNVVGSISDNTMAGTVTGAQYVGAIVGYLDSLNRYDTIENNTYAEGCGADVGIAFVNYVDTSYESPRIPDGTTVFNTGNGTAACPEVAGCAWRSNHNRTDDPLGVDADKLCRVIRQPEPEPEPEPEPVAVDAPEALDGLVYTGKSLTGVAAAEGYTVKGGSATGAGAYTATATLAEGYCWSDGSVEPKQIEWSIAKAQQSIAVSKVAPAVNYNGTLSRTVSGIKTATAKGAVTFSLAGVAPSANIKLVPGAGLCQIKVAAGMPVGTYAVTVRVNAAETANYAAASRDVKVTVSVKRFAPTISILAKYNRAANASTLKAKAVTVENPIAKVQCASKPMAYTLSSAKNASGKTVTSKFTVNKTTGKVTIAKGTAKGTYTLNIKVSSAETSNYKGNYKMVACKIIVK